MENKVVNTELTYKDILKQQYMAVDPLDTNTINECLDEISEKMANAKSKFFMLLSTECSDFTVFNITHYTNFEKDTIKSTLLETLENRGEIMDIKDGMNTNSWEFWIKRDGECFFYALFDYNDGVVII